MSDQALKIAIDLMHIPSRVQMVRSGPLPSGLELLLRIAAGDEAAESEAASSTGRSRAFIKNAAEFFIEQILLSPAADSYRVLGVSPEGTTADLRRNMALLMRWLHPDLDQGGQRSVFASRVALAWNDLKTTERRSTYDQKRRPSPAETRSGGAKKTSSGRILTSHHGHKSRRASHLYTDGEYSILRRIFGWIGGLSSSSSR